MKRTIKLINEQFAQTLNGDGFNSSNGVFKVNYKAYSDLSMSVGRDPDPSLLVKDSAFQVGDVVKGKLKNGKTVKGEVIETSKSIDGKSYIIKVQSLKDKKNYTLVPGSIEFIEDNGNSQNVIGMGISSREKNAQNLKYNGGNIIWGSLENKVLDHPYSTPEGGSVEGPLKTGWRIEIVDTLPQGDLLFNSVIVDKNKKTIYLSRSSGNNSFKDIIKAAEALCYFVYNDEISNEDQDLKAILAILFLELKNEGEAKKQLIQNFPEICGKSYGEARDEQLNKASTIINRFM